MIPFRRLKAWESSHQLVLAIYKETRQWPSDERFGLVAQARRAAVSVTLNLAEGSARLGGRELRRFADMSLGSLAELSALLQIALDLQYLVAEDWVRLEDLRNSAGKLIYGIARSAIRVRAGQ
jgi:four helix bundle protein